MKRVQDRTVWSCIHCRQLIEVTAPIDVIDHLLDDHREILIRDKPVLPVVSRRS